MNEPITVQEARALIAKAREMAEAATDGPWVTETIGGYIYGRVKRGRPNGELIYRPEKQLHESEQANAAFIVMARAAFEPMLDCLERQIQLSVDCWGYTTKFLSHDAIYAPLAALRSHLEAK